MKNISVRISDSYISFYGGDGTTSYARYGSYNWTARSAWKDYYRRARIWKRNFGYLYA